MTNRNGPLWAVLLSVLLLTSCGTTAPADSPTRQNGDYAKQGANSGRLRGSLATICAEDVVIQGNYAYVADGPGGVAIINIKDPTKPSLVRTIGTQYAIRVYIHDGYLYQCDGPAGIHVYSLANPANPARTCSAPARWACGLAFNNGYMYLGDYFEGVKIFDLGDPAQPKLTTYNVIARARDLCVDGTTLVVADSAFGLVTYRLHTPSVPVWTYVDATRFGNFEDIIGYKGYSYIARNDDFTNISVFRTSDPNNIKLVDEIHPTRFIDGLTRCGEVMLAACGDDGILAFDLRTPANPPLMWVIDTPGYARRAKASGNLLYVADMEGLSIFDITGLGGNFYGN